MPENLRINELQTKANLTEELIQVLKAQILELTKTVKTLHITKRLEKIQAENAKLEKAILQSKGKLIALQEKNGIDQIPLPNNGTSIEKVTKQKEKIKKDKKPDTSTNVKKEIDFGRLDLRVGKIVAIDDHPNAEKLFVETIDLGEKEPRKIISGIRNHYSKEQLLDQKVIVLCNLKPAKLRGEMSYGMLLCATSENNTVEILQPPEQATVGDVIVAGGNERHPDKELVPSEKVFETLVKDLKINENKLLVYINDIVEVKGKICGPISTKSLSNCSKVG